MVGVQRKRVVKDKARKVYTSQKLQGLGSCKEILLSPKSKEKLLKSFMQGDGSVRFVLEEATLKDKIVFGL